MDAVLTILLKKVIDVIGGEAAGALKDTKNKKPELKLLDGLRDLEEVLRSAPRVILLAEQYTRNEERHSNFELQSEIQKFVYSFIVALDKTQNAFDITGTNLEIYGSRSTRDSLEKLLGDDAEAMYFFHANYNCEHISEEKWMELFNALSSEIAKARITVADFIRANYDLK